MTRRMSVTTTFLTLVTLFAVSNASAQTCENGNCRLQSQPAPFAGLFSVFGARGIYQRRNIHDPVYAGYGNQRLQGRSVSRSGDGQCGLNGVCANCNCTGGTCTCGPDCPAHDQSQRLLQTQPPLPLPQLTRRYGDSAIQAPRPAPNPHRPVSHATSIKWESNFRAATERSRVSGQPLLIQVTADWCGYCQQMKRETFTNRNLIREANRGFVTVKLDADANRQLVQQMTIKSLPTTIVMLPNMQVVERLEGFQTATQLLSALSRHLPRAELDTDVRVAAR